MPRPANPNRDEAVRRVLDQEPPKQVAADLDVPIATLTWWLRRANVRKKWVQEKEATT